MRKNGIEKQFAIAERSSRKWPDHQSKLAAKIFRETATLEEPKMQDRQYLKSDIYTQSSFEDAIAFSIKEKVFTVRDEELELVVKLIKCGFSLSESWQFLRSMKIVKPWKIIEEEGFSTVNDYSLERIQVVERRI